MLHDEYQAKLRTQRETVGLRLDTIRANLAELETEYEELEVALRGSKCWRCWHGAKERSRAQVKAVSGVSDLSDSR